MPTQPPEPGAQALAGVEMCNAGRPMLVGYSGGLDSTVLLHLMAMQPDVRACGLRAVHVHHGLHADADAWSTHCERMCDSLGVELRIERVQVEGKRLGREGSARAARHDAFKRVLGDDEVLVLAHHRDDQAETFLLRALRGSGVDGLAAMRSWRAYARGWLWRPFLHAPRSALRAYADDNLLSWIEDPSNDDTSIDRNFLRAQVMPLLQTRWPQADAAFARSAALTASAADLLDAGDDAALSSVRNRDETLSVDGLKALAGARRARVLRRWVTQRGLPPLPAHGIACIEHNLLHARPDGEACFEWSSASILNWRGRLHAHSMAVVLPVAWTHAWSGSEILPLPTGDTLELLGAARFDAPLRAHARQGGERIQLPGRTHHHALKHVLQDRGIPPWQRSGMPLLSDAAGHLQAAGDAIIAHGLQAWLHSHGARLHWHRTPAP